MHTAVTLLNESGRWLVAQLGRMSVELAILAGIVLVALYVLRVKSPALRHLFWGLLLAKPVATFLVASPLSLYAVLWPPAPQVTYMPPPVVVQAEPAPALPPVAPQPEAAPPTPAPAPKTPPVWRQVDRYGLASAIWVSVASILGLRLLLGCTYVTFLRTTARPRRNGFLAELVAEAAVTLRVRRHVAIATTNVCHGPVLAGIFRPVILLPENMAEALTRPQLKLVVTHELAHARRWDNLVLLIQRLAEMLFFFHPVVWICGWMMRREAEAACDDMVVSAYGEPNGDSAAAYADSLTRVAEMKCGITRRLLVNTFAAAESNFHRRIRRILNGKRTRMTLWLGFATGAALILIGVLGLPAASAPKAPDMPAGIYATPEGGYTHLITFEPAGDFQPKTPRELLDVFNGVCKARTGYFRTAPQDGKLIGHICTDAPEDIRKSFEKEPRLRFVESVPLTANLFAQHELSKQESAPEDAGDTPGTHTATAVTNDFAAALPDGRSIQLLSVHEHKSDNKSFWRPDGTPLAEAPYEPDKMAENVAAQGKVYEFAFRAKGIQFDGPMQYHFEGSTGWVKRESSDNLGTTVATVVLDAKATTENIRVSIASGDWTTLIAEGPQGGLAESGQEYSVIFGAAYEKDGATCITVTLEGSLSEQAARLCAVDAQGQFHPSVANGSSAGKAKQTTHRFEGLKPQDIKEFQLQTCPWQEVRFSNISLVPGTLTDFKSTVSAVAMQATETSPGPPNSGGTPAQSATADEEQVRQVTEMMQQYDPVAVPGTVSRPPDTQQAPGQGRAASGPLIVAPLIGFLDDKVKAEWQARGVGGDRAVLDRLQVQTVEIMQKRLDGAGMKDVQITKQANGRISVQIPPSADAARASLLLTQPGMSRFCPAATRDEIIQTLQEIEKNPAFQGRLTGLFDTKSSSGFQTVPADKHAAAAAVVGEINDARPRLLPEGRMFILGSKNSPNDLYLIDKNSPMANVKVKSASATTDTDNPGKAKINFSFSDEDAQRFGDLTQSLIGKGLAILVNWEVQSVPIVRSKITKSGQITGNYTPEEAADIAARISVQEYPVQLLVLSDPTTTPGNPEPAEVEDVRKALETRYYSGIDQGLWSRLLCKFLVPVFDPATGEELSFAKYDEAKDELSVRNLPDNLAAFEVMITHFSAGHSQTESAQKKGGVNEPHVTIKDSSNVTFTAGKINGNFEEGRFILMEEPVVHTPEVAEIKGDRVVINSKDKTIEVENARAKEVHLAKVNETSTTGWHEDFERYSSGPGTWPEGWTADGNASNHEICHVDGATFKDTHGNTLRLHGDTPAWSPLAHFMTNVKVPFKIAFDVYLESKDPKCTCVVGVRTKPSWTAPGIILFDTIPPGAVNGLEPVAEGGEMSKGLSTDQLHMDVAKWYHVELILQEEQGKQSLSITLNDGTGAQGPVQLSTDTAPVKDMPYLQLEVRSGTAWFDNVSMSPAVADNTASSGTGESAKANVQNAAGNDDKVGTVQESNPGKITGVVSDLEGKPVTNAYVGVGDTGDSGGSNHERHRQEGIYAQGKTDGEGRFALDGLALNREHLLFVTHPDFVRADRKFTLDTANPAQDFTFALTVAGKINVTFPNTPGGLGRDTLRNRAFIRLEALDGHRFIQPGRDPHLSAFASNVWLSTPPDADFLFSELDAGNYAIAVTAQFPVLNMPAGVLSTEQRDAALTATYYGGVPSLALANGQVVDVAVPPADNGTRVRIGIPNTPEVPEDFPRLLAITRDLTFLKEQTISAKSLEDIRLGRLWQGALYFSRLPGRLFVGDKDGHTFCTIVNLPPGEYCVFAGPPTQLHSSPLNVAKGRDETVELPVNPDAAAKSSASAVSGGIIPPSVRAGDTSADSADVALAQDRTRDADNAPPYTAEMRLLAGPRASVESLCAELKTDREMVHGPEAERVFITRDEKGIGAVFEASDRYSDLELISAPRVTFKAVEDPAESEGKEGGEMPKVVLRAETAGPRFVAGEVLKTPGLEAFYGDYSASLLAFYRNERPTAVIADMQEDLLDKRVRGEEPKGIPEGVSMALRLTKTEQSDAFGLKFYFNKKDVVQPSRGLAFWKPAPPPDVFESPVALRMTPPNPYRLGEWVVVVTKNRDPEKSSVALLHINRAAPGTRYAEAQSPTAMDAAGTAYREAQKSYAQRDYKTALEQFCRYLEQHPGVENADNAQFWKAKCLWSLDRPDEAVTAFEKVRLNYPTSAKVPFAMHQEGLCRAGQGQTQRATELLQRTMRDYPSTPAADQAKQDLERLQQPVVQ